MLKPTCHKINFPNIYGDDTKKDIFDPYLRLTASNTPVYNRAI